MSTVREPPRVVVLTADGLLKVRTDHTPADTAETSTNRRCVCWLTIAAMVVPRYVTAITSVEARVSERKLAMLYENRKETTMDGTTISNRA